MLFKDLIVANKEIWDGYVNHDFVKALENGTLPRENFLFYLKQDYIYLINYAKCYARLALNATNAQELRFAMRFQNYIVDGEMALHSGILALGIDADELKHESLANIAYTRYMLNIGERGDFIDILVALSACAIGYGYIGAQMATKIARNLGFYEAPKMRKSYNESVDFVASLSEDDFSKIIKSLENHPYKDWILTYCGTDFIAQILDFEAFVNSYSTQISEAKFKNLSEIFAIVTRLETAFWQHGLKMDLGF